jgi:hypothetical protein
MLFTNPDSPFQIGIAKLTSSGFPHLDWGDGASGFAREIFDHQGLYPPYW